MRNFFRNFYEIIKMTKSRNATINEMLSTLNFLLHEYQIEIARYVENSFMKATIKFDRLKLQKY